MRRDEKLLAGFARIALAAGLGAALAACQPTLDPVVPAGDVAYASIAVPDGPDRQGRYLLQPGDTVSVLVFQEPDLSQEEARIDPSGNLDLPLIGTLQAAGLSPSELGLQIESAYAARYLRDPRVTVRLDEAVKRTIAVEGEVEQPGVFEVQPGYTLLTALALARSPKNTAQLDEVIIFRTIDGRRTGGLFNVTDIRSGKAQDPAIMPGDVVVVGFSALRGGYRDILQAAPLFNVFTQF